MPVRKRKDRRRSAVPPWAVEMDLDIGWLSDRNDEEIRAAWEQYGAYMLAENAEHHPGQRPYAWWIFDKEVPAPDIHDQADALFDMGEMDAHEIERVRMTWRGAPPEMLPKFMLAAEHG